MAVALLVVPGYLLQRVDSSVVTDGPVEDVKPPLEFQHQEMDHPPQVIRSWLTRLCIREKPSASIHLLAPHHSNELALRDSQ